MGAIALLVLLWAGTGDASFTNIVYKCCPQEQSLTESFDCRLSGHQWFYMNFTYGFPNCDYALVSVNESELVSCIDNSFETGSIVALKCKTDPFRFPVPEVHYVRKCCSLDKTFNSVQQSCYGETSGGSRPPKDLFNVLMSGFKGIVDIRVGAPICDKGFVLVDYLVHFNKVSREESESIVYHGDKLRYFNPDEVCMDFTERHDILVIRACQPEEVVCRPKGQITCLPKCCEEGKAFTGNHSSRCVPAERAMGPIKFYNVTSEGAIEHEMSTPAFFQQQLCEKYVLNPQTNPKDVYYIGIDGLLYMIGEDGRPVGAKDYCIEDTFYTDENLDGVYVHKCFDDQYYDGMEESGSIVVNSYGMIVSIVFLFLTLLVYSCLPSLRNLHGKTLMCYIISLLCAYTTHSIIVFASPQGDETSPGPGPFYFCKALAFADHFAFTASFFWLNVISFDIWWNFGSIRPKSGRRANGKKRWASYNGFAWGMSSIVTAIAIISQETEWFPEYARADMGLSTCWYEKETYGFYIYFITPTSISQVSNVVFFILTARHCAKVRNDLQRMVHTNSEERRFKADKKKFIMHLKLFVVMGVSWALENVSHSDIHNTVYLFYFSDLVNALQGLFIFGIFIMKKKVLKAFSRKLKEVFGLAKPRHHCPSTSSTVFTVTLSNNKLNSVGRPPVLKKSCSDSRLSICTMPQGIRQLRGHARTFSSNSNNSSSLIYDPKLRPS